MKDTAQSHPPKIWEGVLNTLTRVIIQLQKCKNTSPFKSKIVLNEEVRGESKKLKQGLIKYKKKMKVESEN